MEEIIELTKIDFSYVFIAVFVILVGVKVMVSLFEWVVNKLGLETKWMRKQREEHDLLIQTSQGLIELQEHHKKDMERSDKRDEEIANDIKNLTRMFVDKEIDDMRWEINNLLQTFLKASHVIRIVSSTVFIYMKNTKKY